MQDQRRGGDQYLNTLRPKIFAVIQNDLFVLEIDRVQFIDDVLIRLPAAFILFPEVVARLLCRAQIPQQFLNAVILFFILVKGNEFIQIDASGDHCRFFRGRAIVAEKLQKFAF